MMREKKPLSQSSESDGAMFWQSVEELEHVKLDRKNKTKVLKREKSEEKATWTGHDIVSKKDRRQCPHEEDATWTGHDIGSKKGERLCP